MLRNEGGVLNITVKEGDEWFPHIEIATLWEEIKTSASTTKIK